MAKITGPLLSLTARGSFGPRLTFSKRTSGQQVRTQRAQKDYENPARAEQRALYGAGVEAWRALSDAEKEQWSQDAAGRHMTGYNLFMKNYMLGLIVVAEYILLETGAFLLLEDGGRVRVE